MRIAVGWDHRGRCFRERLERAVTALGHEFIALGATTDDPSDDYPDFAFRVAEAVSRGEADRGVLVCGSGIGMAIAANKVPGIRAGVVGDEKNAVLSRAHNDTNVLCLGEETSEGSLMERLLTIWLKTPFDGGRHARRVDKIIDYERGKTLGHGR